MLQVKVNFNKPGYETNLGNSIFSHQPKILVNKKNSSRYFKIKWIFLKVKQLKMQSNYNMLAKLCILQSTYNLVQYDTLRYITIQYDTIQYNTLRYNTTRYNKIQYNTLRYNTTRYNKIRYDTIQYNTHANVSIRGHY